MRSRRSWKPTAADTARRVRSSTKSAAADNVPYTREDAFMSPAGKQVAVVVGATSKWQADGRNTKLAHGKAIDDSHLPVGIRWGVGGAVAQKFAREGFFVVLTTRQDRKSVV